MGKRSGLQAVISVIDKVTAPMKKINRQVFAVAKGFGGLGRSVLGLGTKISSLLGPLSAIGGVASVSGILGLANSYSAAGDKIAKTADRLGVGVEALQSLTFAADRSGVKAATLNMALQRLNRRAADAASGKNKNLAELFDSLGISLQDANGQLRTSADLLPELADGFSKVENPAVRTKMAFALFDSEGVQLVNMLKGGSQEMRALQDEAVKLGLVMSEDAAREAEAFTDSMTNMQGILTGVRNLIGERLLPKLRPLIDMFTAWVLANREIIASKIDGLISRIVEYISAINWSEVWSSIQGIAKSVSRAVEFFGGWENVLIGLVVLMNGGLIAAILSVGQAIFRLGVLLVANPIGLVIAAIAAGAALIIANWDDVGPWFESMWSKVRSVFSSGWDVIAGLMTGDTERVIEGAKGYWSVLSDFWSDMWAGMRATLEYFGVDVDALIGRVSDVIDKVLGKLAEMKAALTDNIVVNALGDGYNYVFGDDDPPEAPSGAGLIDRGGVNVRGGLDVNFNNAPEGMRVAPSESNYSGFNFNPIVGYRRGVMAGS